MTAFEKETGENVVTFTVNLSRATMNEANEFRKVIDNEIGENTNNIIIDLSSCEFIDSTFIGVLVITLKKLAALGRELRLVKPVLDMSSILEVTDILHIFNVYNSKAEAIENFRFATPV